jgi:hypothetical protein
MSVDAQIATYLGGALQHVCAFGTDEVKISSRDTPRVEVGRPLC